MRGRGAVIGAAALVAAVGAVLVVAGPPLEPGVALPPPWPSAPYDHEPLDETSVATTVATGGEVGRMATGLETAGFFCAQVRANDAAVQVWCRRADTALGPDTVAVTVVDLVAAPDGALQYAHVELPPKPLSATAGGASYADRLLAVLDASLWQVWAGDRDDVQAAVEDLGQPFRGWDAGDPRPAESRRADTDHGTYTVTERPDVGVSGTVDDDPALELAVSTPRLRDNSWPYGSEHYATTTVAAAPGLEAGGFDCYGDIEQPCTRPAGNQQIDYRTFSTTDRILSAGFGTGGGVLDPTVGLQPLSAWGFPQGLTFLTDAVRTAVEERIDAARRTGESFVGIVSGVVVVLDAGRTPLAADGTYAVRVQVTIGTPLVAVPLG